VTVAKFGDSRRFQRQSPNATVFRDSRRFRWQSPISATISEFGDCIASVDKDVRTSGLGDGTTIFCWRSSSKSLFWTRHDQFCTWKTTHTDTGFFTKTSAGGFYDFRPFRLRICEIGSRLLLITHKKVLSELSIGIKINDFEWVNEDFKNTLRHIAGRAFSGLRVGLLLGVDYNLPVLVATQISSSWMVVYKTWISHVCPQALVSCCIRKIGNLTWNWQNIE